MPSQLCRLCEGQHGIKCHALHQKQKWKRTTKQRETKLFHRTVCKSLIHCSWYTSLRVDKKQKIKLWKRERQRETETERQKQRERESMQILERERKRGGSGRTETEKHRGYRRQRRQERLWPEDMTPFCADLVKVTVPLRTLYNEFCSRVDRVLRHL